MYAHTLDVGRTQATLVTRMLLLTACSSLSTLPLKTCRRRGKTRQRCAQAHHQTLVRHRRSKEQLHCTRTSLSFRRVSTTKYLRPIQQCYTRLVATERFTKKQRAPNPDIRCSKRPPQPAKALAPNPGEQRQYSVPPPAGLDEIGIVPCSCGPVRVSNETYASRGESKRDPCAVANKYPPISSTKHMLAQRPPR